MTILLSRRSIGILAIILILSSTAAGYFHDQSIKGVYASLEPQIYGEKNQISQLQNTVNNKNTEISQLQAANVDGWFAFSGTQCSNSCLVRGAYSNYGILTARNIVVTLMWTNNGIVVKNLNVSLPDLGGRITQLFPLGNTAQNFTLVSTANRLDWCFSWTS